MDDKYNFIEILRNLNEKMRKENRWILLFLDNATCHPKIILSNIKLVFFPPNTTSKLQPLDSGIIQNLKCNYRKLMLKKLIIEMDKTKKASEKLKEINILDSIMFLKESLNNIKTSTVTKCFEKVGFRFEGEVKNNESNESDVIINEVENLIEAIYNNNELSVRDYIEVDYDEDNEINPNNFMNEIVNENDSDKNTLI